MGGRGEGGEGEGERERRRKKEEKEVVHRIRYWRNVPFFPPQCQNHLILAQVVRLL